MVHVPDDGRKRRRVRKDGKKVKVQIVLEEDVVKKVDYYAKKYNISRSYFCAQAVVEDVTEDSLIHDMALSPMMKPAAMLLSKLYGEKNKRKREEYMKTLDYMTRNNLEEM